MTSDPTSEASWGLILKIEINRGQNVIYSAISYFEWKIGINHFCSYNSEKVITYWKLFNDERIGPLGPRTGPLPAPEGRALTAEGGREYDINYIVYNSYNTRE